MKRSLFNSLITSGNTTKVITQPILRDVVETPKKETKEEPKVEVKMSGEPSLDILNEEPKTKRIKKSTPKQNTNEEA